MATPSRNFFSASPDAAPLLRLEDLSVHFPFEGHLLPAVRDVHLELPPAAITCLVGESGCGKSLTARAVLRLTPETAVLGGRALLRGEDLLSLPEKELRGIRGRRVGMIFQEPMTSLNPVLRVGEQVAEPLRLHLGMGRAEARREAERLFADVGIPSPHSRYDDYPHQLSGGMRQRVMIAMALACRPELLLADEPTTALDATIQGQILRLILDQSRERGMAVLLITHDLGVVAEVADVVGVMYAGRLVERAPARELFADPRHPYTRGLMHSAPSRRSMGLSRLPTIPGSVPSLQNMPPGCPFQPRCPEAMPRCAEAMPPSFIRGGHAVACWLADATA
ncbi:oligopeptide/dipeptide ABC transporter, ATP-binding protein domain [Desulfovibrio sp. 3_1_syn3]|uniref:ABC transporter ATP-binding protein n=1 Tax=Desulfovibrio sp. 3_1_syn3 TaxID=457398 RepID=UPI0001E12CD3|nr:ABC transporter ATP-binding protein [Desulfovibrio sp. 3_1_syn3]EFL85035.1 oligopeptide/dipeptide ABC transporter, ATP-binding protein domain [Desulfovibrio sp. 3_1_syn3]